jgi:Fic family protein
VAAMQHGLRRIAGGFPLSLRLIREIHAILLRGGCGANRTPGEFRRSQNWVGGTYKLPILVEAGLVHVQFETMHPFFDGNGRLGRLLITLLLCLFVVEKALKAVETLHLARRLNQANSVMHLRTYLRVDEFSMVSSA